jgi:hypothetical protein
MKTSYIPLGPVGKILVAKESGFVGKCVSSFWPVSGEFNKISVNLRTSTDAIYKLPLSSVDTASNSERDDFLQQTRRM